MKYIVIALVYFSSLLSASDATFFTIKSTLDFTQKDIQKISYYKTFDNRFAVEIICTNEGQKKLSQLLENSVNDGLGFKVKDKVILFNSIIRENIMKKNNKFEIVVASEKEAQSILQIKEKSNLNK